MSQNQTSAAAECLLTVDHDFDNDLFFKLFFMRCRKQQSLEMNQGVKKTHIDKWFKFTGRSKTAPQNLHLRTDEEKNNWITLSRETELATTHQSKVYRYRCKEHPKIQCVIKFAKGGKKQLDEDQEFISHWLPHMSAHERCTSRLIPSAFVRYMVPSDTLRIFKPKPKPEEQRYVCVIMPSMDGDASDYFERAPPQEAASQVSSFGKNLFHALDCLQRRMVFYLDFKPANVLYRKLSDGVIKWWLSDLGSISVKFHSVPETYPYPFKQELRKQIGYIQDQTIREQVVLNYYLVRLHWAFLTGCVSACVMALRASDTPLKITRLLYYKELSNLRKLYPDHQKFKAELIRMTMEWKQAISQYGASLQPILGKIADDMHLLLQFDSHLNANWSNQWRKCETIFHDT